MKELSVKKRLQSKMVAKLYETEVKAENYFKTKKEVLQIVEAKQS